MSDSTNKISREQMIELVKAARDQAKTEDLEKSDAAPVEVARAVGKALRDQIAAHQEELVKMRTLEVATLKKKLGGTPNSPPPGHPLAAPAAPPPKAVGDPAWNGNWNVVHDTDHGTYRTQGALHANGAQGVDLLYAPKKSLIPGRAGSFKVLGQYADKHQASAARLHHHDLKAAGILKEEMNETVEKAGAVSEPALNPKNNPGKDMSAENPSQKAKLGTSTMGTFVRNNYKQDPATMAAEAKAAGKESLNNQLATPKPPLTKTIFDVLKPAQAPAAGSPEQHAQAIKAEDFIDLKNANDTDKRLTDGNGKDTVVPSDKPSKEIPAEGSGGEMKKDAIGDTHVNPIGAQKQSSLKPAGVPAASPPPKAPSVPSAPGMSGGVNKSETTIFDVLKKGDFGMGDNGKALTAPPIAPPTAKPQYTMANLKAGKAKLNAQSLPNPSKPLAPTMEEHAQRTGKFGKAEFEGEACPYCTKSLSKCSC